MNFFDTRKFAFMADYKLADMLGIAGATIAIIIAAGVMLQTISTRYISDYERYRSLTSELRGHNGKDVRQERLLQEIVLCRRQILYLNYGSILVTCAVIAFLATVALASLAVAYPQEMFLRGSAASPCSADLP